MPTITLSKKVLEKEIGKLSLEKLKDRITMLGTDLESIEGDEIIVEVFPNRPDMLSEQGFARALASFIGKKTGLRNYKVKNSNERVIIDKSVKSVRPYTACSIVKNLKFDDEKIKEVIDIQEKLHITYCRNRKKAAIGIYPFEKIKTPIRYLARKPENIQFIPLDSGGVMNGREILSKHKAGREYGYLLEGYKEYPVFIDANDNILSMPPIINSELTGKITNNTKEVFIECSGFELKVLNICLNIIVSALADMGGEIYSMKLEYPGKKFVTPELKPRKIKLNLDYVNKILGLNLKLNEVKKLLERMGYGLQEKEVLVPAYRADILHLMDIVEDIGIAYGYENFKIEIPKIAGIGEENEFEKFKRKISEILVGLGLYECNSYHLINKEILKKMNLSKEKIIEIENPLSAEYNCLRSNMIGSLLQILKDNKHNEYPQRIFDTGIVFKEGKRETNVDEICRVGVLSCHSSADYTEARQFLDALLSNLGLNYKVDEAEHESFIPGRAGRVSVNGKKIAYIGEIHPKVLENFGLEVPVAGFELNLTELFDILK